MYSKLATKMSVAVELIDTREAERDEARQIAREACSRIEDVARVALLHAEERYGYDDQARLNLQSFLARPDVQRLMTQEGK
jgi:hypothetical protein